MAEHHLLGEIISTERPLAVISVSGGDGTSSHLIAGETIDADHPLAVEDVNGVANPVAALASGRKIAAGVHTQAAASDTVATGLVTVLAVVVSFQTDPTVKQWMCSASVGNQAGAPVAGSVIIKTFKPTDSTIDATPTAATDFTGTPKVNWIAVGT